MALGYCPTCDRLTQIVPGPQRWGSREREWRTVEHENESGKRCENRRAL